MCRYWRELDPGHPVIVAYGGSSENFDALEAGSAVFVEDPWLRTRDHPRERQSYLGVFRAALPRIVELGATHVHLAEFDEIPLVAGMNGNLLALLDSENADVIGHRLERVDNSSHPHYTFHRGSPGFEDYWRSITRRENPSVVLSMLGCGSFWRREAFEAVARLESAPRIYLEIMLPTAAHHLGFRVRPIGEQDRFVAPEIPKSREDFDAFRRKGAWRIHPVKGYWTADRANDSP